MLEFIAQYWLTFVFGLIASGLGIALKKVWSLYKKERIMKYEEEKKEILEEVETKLEEQNEKLEQTDNEIKEEITHLDANLQVLTQGILSTQGHDFRDACRRLLEPGHIISVDEYEQICADHIVYKDLGGNHLGDQLFQSIEKKFNLQTSID